MPHHFPMIFSNILYYYCVSLPFEFCVVLRVVILKILCLPPMLLSLFTGDYCAFLCAVFIFTSSLTLPNVANLLLFYQKKIFHTIKSLVRYQIWVLFMCQHPCILVSSYLRTYILTCLLTYKAIQVTSWYSNLSNGAWRTIIAFHPRIYLSHLHSWQFVKHMHCTCDQ